MTYPSEILETRARCLARIGPHIPAATMIDELMKHLAILDDQSLTGIVRNQAMAEVRDILSRNERNRYIKWYTDNAVIKAKQTRRLIKNEQIYIEKLQSLKKSKALYKRLGLSTKDLHLAHLKWARWAAKAKKIRRGEALQVCEKDNLDQELLNQIESAFTFKTEDGDVKTLTAPSNHYLNTKCPDCDGIGFTKSMKQKSYYCVHCGLELVYTIDCPKYISPRKDYRPFGAFRDIKSKAYNDNYHAFCHPRQCNKKRCEIKRIIKDQEDFDTRKLNQYIARPLETGLRFKIKTKAAKFALESSAFDWLPKDQRKKARKEFLNLSRLAQGGLIALGANGMVQFCEAFYQLARAPGYYQGERLNGSLFTKQTRRAIRRKYWLPRIDRARKTAIAIKRASLKPKKAMLDLIPSTEKEIKTGVDDLLGDLRGIANPTKDIQESIEKLQEIKDKILWFKELDLDIPNDLREVARYWKFAIEERVYAPNFNDLLDKALLF